MSDLSVERADAFARDRARIEVLRRTHLLDAGVQDSLQRLARLAADLTGAPISLVTLVDSDRQYFAAKLGLDLDEAPLEGSFCKYVMAEDRQLCVEDSLLDPVLAQTVAGAAAPVRAYLGSPLAAGGARLGALCVTDLEPRAWGERERRIVADLAHAASTDIELRLQVDAFQSLTYVDPLTGLGNRRALARELERRLSDGADFLLGMFDLDGFKAYNDTFGHPAGDDLLRRLAGRAQGVCGPGEAFFRMGGDEFCMIATDREGLSRAERAMEERGPGYAIRCSLGVAEIPGEAADVTGAIAVADRRMYGRKPARHTAIDMTVARVLHRAIVERDHTLSDHVDQVADLARRVAVELAADPETVRDTELAGRLHDVGKMAISDAILEKRGPLDADEWAQMRSHTLIGERILAAAPPLAPVAHLVRSSHERFDGGGYPDGLAGPDIPLGSRIIFACDAWDAMTSDRAYRRALPVADAEAELRRQAGTQFDPQVVEALLRVRRDL